MKKRLPKPQSRTDATVSAEAEADKAADRLKLEGRIRKRAHEIHLARGGNPGRDLDDWLQAEREILALTDSTNSAAS